MTTLAELRATFRHHLHLPDASVVDFAAAVAVSNNLSGDPLWAFIVGAPSSGKTEVLEALGDCTHVYAMSNLTPKTLISGAPIKYDEDEDGVRTVRFDPSLLKRLPTDHPTLLTLKDFTTVLQKRDADRAEIISQLREVYDGAYRMEFGTGASVEWTGRIGFLAGCTPALDVYHSVLSVLGERFVYFRLPDVHEDRRTIAKRARMADDDSAERKAMRRDMRRFVEGVRRGGPDMPDDVGEQLDALADLVTWARSGVIRDSYGARDILARPSPESPARFNKQMVTLWAACGAMEHEDPMAMVQRVAHDSMPRERWDVLSFLALHELATSTELKDHLRLPKSSAYRIIDDMVALDLVQLIEHGRPATDPRGGTPSVYALTTDARERWDSASISFTPPVPEKTPQGGVRGKEEGDEGVWGASMGTGIDLNIDLNEEVPF